MTVNTYNSNNFSELYLVSSNSAFITNVFLAQHSIKTIMVNRWIINNIFYTSKNELKFREILLQEGAIVYICYSISSVKLK